MLKGFTFVLLFRLFFFLLIKIEQGLSEISMFKWIISPPFVCCSRMNSESPCAPRSAFLIFLHTFPAALAQSWARAAGNWA